MKTLYIVISLVLILSIKSYAQTPFLNNSIWIGYPLNKVLQDFINVVHQDSLNGTVLINLTLNKLTENKQVYRISTFKYISRVRDNDFLLNYAKINNDFVFFSVAYSCQLGVGMGSYNYSFDSYIGSNICHSQDYWEVIIKKDKYYKIKTNITGPQTLRKGKKIHFHKPKTDE
jgi:hypothetical protein